MKELAYWKSLKDWCRFLRICGHEFGSPEMRRGLEDFRAGWRQGAMTG